MTFGRSFADLHIGEPLVYVNSLDNIGIAINQGSFADAYRVGREQIGRSQSAKHRELFMNESY